MGVRGNDFSEIQTEKNGAVAGTVVYLCSCFDKYESVSSPVMKVAHPWHSADLSVLGLRTSVGIGFATHGFRVVQNSRWHLLQHVGPFIAAVAMLTEISWQWCTRDFQRPPFGWK